MLLMNGCVRENDQSAQAQTVYDVFITKNPEAHEEAGYEEKIQGELIHDEFAEVIKIGITLKRNPSIYDKIEYVDSNVTALEFFKCAIVGIEGLGQLEFLDTIVFSKSADLEDFSFLKEIPQLRRLFIDYNNNNIDWSFIEQLPNLEVLSIGSYYQPTVSIDLKNNERLEYIMLSGALEIFPDLLNVPDSLKYLNLEGNKIATLPSDIEKYSHTTVILSINPFEKNETIPDNITVEFADRILGRTYSMPDDDGSITYISDLNY